MRNSIKWHRVSPEITSHLIISLLLIFLGYYLVLSSKLTTLDNLNITLAKQLKIKNQLQLLQKKERRLSKKNILSINQPIQKTAYINEITHAIKRSHLRIRALSPVGQTNNLQLHITLLGSYQAYISLLDHLKRMHYAVQLNEVKLYQSKGLIMSLNVALNHA